jgi:hypothetical protein
MGQSRVLFHRAEIYSAASRMAAAVPRKSGDDGCTFGAIDQTGTAQKRCEIIDLAMVVEDFRKEAREAGDCIALRLCLS